MRSKGACISRGQQFCLSPTPHKPLPCPYTNWRPMRPNTVLSPQTRVKWAWVHGADRELVLRWTETGGPPVEPPTRKGFGSRVITGMIEQLKGTVRFNWHPSGLVCEISIRV